MERKFNLLNLLARLERMSCIMLIKGKQDLCLEYHKKAIEVTEKLKTLLCESEYLIYTGGVAQVHIVTSNVKNKNYTYDFVQSSNEYSLKAF